MIDLTVATARASCRGSSEDRLLVQELPIGLLVVVADGAGGMSGGARAAELFIEHARSRVESRTFDRSSGEAWTDVLFDADRRIATDPAAGETTGIALLVTRAGISGASAGDSEAWLVGTGGHDVLTTDQRRKRLGTGKAVPVAFRRASWLGTLLVATDGLLAYAQPEVLCEILAGGDLQAAAQRLLASVQLPSGGFPDDVSVALARGS
jgi:serine/threonine protein phosphatase PrpC